MTVLIGTTAGLFDHEGQMVIEGTRINHVARTTETTWVVDGKGRLHEGGTVVASIEGGLAALCVQPTHDAIFVGTSEARLFRLEAGRLVEDEFFADAPGREEWHTPWGGPPDVRSMAVDRRGTLYINVHVGGILRYDNTGIAPTIDLHADVHQVVADARREGVVFAATAYGLASSSNGHDYATRGEGLFAPYCRAVAFLDDMVFVTASNGPRATEGRLYRTDRAGSPFAGVGSGLPDRFDANVDTHCLAVIGDDVFLGHGDKVWRSGDGGENWEEVVAGLPRVTCLG